jgi:hypothetical protein
MSVLKMCSIYDSKAEAWMTPMFFQAVGQAVRSFSDAVNDKSSEFGKHPEDYVLFAVADFDDRSGEVDASVCESLVKGINLVKESD